MLFVRGEDPGGWGSWHPWKYEGGQSMFWTPKMSHSSIQNCCWITLQVSQHQGWKTCIKEKLKLIFEAPTCCQEPALGYCFEIIDAGFNTKQFDGLIWLTLTLNMGIFYDRSTPLLSVKTSTPTVIHRLSKMLIVPLSPSSQKMSLNYVHILKISGCQKSFGGNSRVSRIRNMTCITVKKFPQVFHVLLTW